MKKMIALLLLVACAPEPGDMRVHCLESHKELIGIDCRRDPILDMVFCEPVEVSVCDREQLQCYNGQRWRPLPCGVEAL